MQRRRTLDNEIMKNVSLRTELDRGIDDLKAGHVYTEEEAERLIIKKTKELLLSKKQDDIDDLTLIRQIRERTGRNPMTTEEIESEIAASRVELR